jgi:hypothetical protein
LIFAQTRAGDTGKKQHYTIWPHGTEATIGPQTSLPGLTQDPFALLTLALLQYHRLLPRS